MARVVVAGTLYIDLVLPFAHLPKPGETVVASERRRWVGGKGANQAVMCRRLGVETRLIGSVGADTDGDFLLASLREEGVDCSLVARQTSLGTGLSVIAVDPAAHNMILSYGGANSVYPESAWTAADAAVSACDAFLLHAEFPQAAAIRLVRTAREHGVPVFVTPAPPEQVPALGLHEGCFIFPNQTEAEALTGVTVNGVAEARRAGRLLIRELGVGAAVITLGEEGAVVTAGPGLGGGFQFHVPARRVEPVDTTAAGDAFCAAFACSWLSRGGAGTLRPEIWEEAGRFAAVAGALTASRAGAVASLPSLGDLEAHLGPAELENGALEGDSGRAST
ncbi:MAG: ribokinase [Betaproteobacteria bacterium]